jgi:hypothetical protein
MKFRIRSLLIALLLSSTSSGFACGTRAVNTGEANIPPRQDGSSSRQDELVPAGWKRYDFQKPLAFSVLLPAQPEQRVSPLLEGAATSHVFISAGNSSVYGATYVSDLPAVASRWESSGSELLYEVFIKDFALALAGGGGERSADLGSKVRFTADRQVIVSGLEGLERDFSSEDFRGRMRLVRVGPAAFCLVAIWKQTAAPAERESFFNSAKIAAG